MVELCLGYVNNRVGDCVFCRSIVYVQGTGNFLIYNGVATWLVNSPSREKQKDEKSGHVEFQGRLNF